MAERQIDRPKQLDLQTVCEMTGYAPTEVALIARTVAQDAPLQELAVFLHACRTLQLDPLLRQAYWIRRKTRDASGREVLRGTLQVGIDGFRKIADSSGAYAGSDPPEFRDWFMLDHNGTEIRCPGVARVLVRKIVQDRPATFTGEAAWAEFYPGPGANGQMWRKMPRHQLAKCAEAQALRKAFPSLLAAVPMADDDGSDSTSVVEVRPQHKSLAGKYREIYGDDDDPPAADVPPAGEPDEGEAADDEHP